MAGFIPMADHAVENNVPLPISSLTLSIGDMIELDAGATTWTAADSSTEHWQLKAICQESATTGDSYVMARLVTTLEPYEVESANNSSANDNGDRMTLTDQNTVNNSGTDVTAEECAFIQMGVLGAAADKRIWGYVIPGTGVNPDAA